MPSAMAASFQVVILAGGECKRLYPLTSAGTVKALLPVGNTPLIGYPLRNLAEAGIRSAIVVAIGEAVSSSMASYLAAQEAAGGVSCNVITVPEDCGTADALRLVAKHITAETLIVYSGDILTDLPVKALLVSHQVSGALATVLVGHRKTSPTSETKPGKPPRGVDYLGIDTARQLLLFAASSPEALRDIKLPVAAVQQAGALELRTDLQDQHLYVLSRAALKLLTSQPSLSSLKLDFIPWLTRHQLKHPPPGDAVDYGGAATAAAAAVEGPGLAAARTDSGALLLSQTPDGFSGLGAASLSHGSSGGPPASASTSSGTPAAAAGGAAAAGAAAPGGQPGPAAAAAGSSSGDGSSGVGGVMPGSGYMLLSHSGAAASSSRSGRVGVFLVPPGRYCGRVNTVQAYGDVNREVAAADTALHLTGLTVSRYDNVVPPSTTLGAKATVGPACIVGDDCVIGDKSSVKRSVMGRNCRLGGNVKVINCVLMDNVVVGDGSHIQNCVICAGAAVQERCSLKDCQVGPGFVVAQASEHKSETLAKT